MKARMKRVVNIVALILIAIGLVVLFWFLIAGKQIDVLEPTGQVARAQHSILVFTTILSAAVVIPVFGLLIYFSVKYRAGNSKARYRPDWSENRTLESIWWGIPILIIGVLAVVTYQTSHSLDPYRAIEGGEPLEVQVVALQWKWLFIYPEQQVATLNHLPIPVDRPVRFTMTAQAPMSAFWIPSLGSQIYAMNGMQSQLNLKAGKIGDYTGYTTNINGEGYAKMKFRTRVMSKTDFADWIVASAKSTAQMNATTYEKLAKPVSETDERTYRLTDAQLFDSLGADAGHGHQQHHQGGHDS